MRPQAQRAVSDVVCPVSCPDAVHAIGATLLSRFFFVLAHPRWGFPQVATHLSAAKEAEKHVNAARRCAFVVHSRPSLPRARQHPLSCACNIHYYGREHKKDPITQHLKSDDLVTNMMSLDMISNRPEVCERWPRSLNRQWRMRGITAAGIL